MTDRFYMSRKEVRRGLANVEDFIDAKILGLEGYIRKSKERLISAANDIDRSVKTNRKN